MALPPKAPEATEVTGDETFFGIQMGRWKRFKSSLLKGQKGDKGDSVKGEKGDPGTPKRVERYTATTNAQGVATFTFSPAFETTPDIQVVPGWGGTGSNQMIGGGVAASSRTGCTVQGKMSVGTLLLNASPFQNAPTGTSITIRAIGN